MNKVLGIDVGGTSIKYGYVSAQGEITNKGSFDTSNLQSLDQFMRLLLSMIKEAVDVGIEKIGISCLGIFNREGTCVGGVENLAFLLHSNLIDLIREKFPKVEVSIMNDGNAAAIGEYWLGQGKDCSSFFNITLGTGVGGAFVIEGKPYLGSHFRSGEIGYSNYQSKNKYFESYFSTKGILEKTANALNLEKIDGLMLIKEVQMGNHVCIEIWDQWMEELGQLIANIILLLDVDKVIIGGGISVQEEMILPILTKKVKEHLPEMFREDAQICMAKLGNDAGLLGAVANFLTI